MKKIDIRVKEYPPYVYLTFAAESVRLKASEEYLRLNQDFWIKYIRKVEPYIYRNYHQTLRGRISYSKHNVNKGSFKITFRTHDKWPVMSIYYTSGKVKIKRHRWKNEKEWVYKIKEVFRWVLNLM